MIATSIHPKSAAENGFQFPRNFSDWPQSMQRRFLQHAVDGISRVSELLPFEAQDIRRVEQPRK